MDKIILKQILLDNQQDVEKYSIIRRNTGHSILEMGIDILIMLKVIA